MEKRELYRFQKDPVFSLTLSERITTVRSFVFSRCPAHVLMMNKMSFQLVTGKTRMYSILHVFSKIGLVMLFCRLVVVRNSFHLSKICLFFIIKICRSSCVPRTKVCGSFFFPITIIIIKCHFLTGSVKLKA